MADGGLQPEFVVPPEADALLECDAGVFSVASYTEPADLSEHTQMDMLDGTSRSRRQRLACPACTSRKTQMRRAA